MPPDPDLFRLIDEASLFVEKQFRAVGRIAPMWIAVDRSGNEVVVPTPVPFVDHAAKDRATRVVRAMFEFTGVTRYVFVCESWLLTNDAGIDLDAAQRDGISQHPDRQEVIILMGESDISGLIFGRRNIVRHAKGKAKLGPLVVDPHDGLAVQGPMASMLPRRKLQS